MPKNSKDSYRITLLNPGTRNSSTMAHKKHRRNDGPSGAQSKGKLALKIIGAGLVGAAVVGGATAGLAHTSLTEGYQELILGGGGALAGILIAMKWPMVGVSVAGAGLFAGLSRYALQMKVDARTNLLFAAASTPAAPTAPGGWPMSYLGAGAPIPANAYMGWQGAGAPIPSNAYFNGVYAG